MLGTMTRPSPPKHRPASDEIVWKSITIKSAVEQDGQRIIDGYAATYEIDQVQDRFEPGSFKSTVAQRGPKQVAQGSVQDGAVASNIKVMYQHREPIGLPLPGQLFEDSNGLYFKAQIVECFWGDEAWKLIKTRVIDKVSVGFRIVKFDYENLDDGRQIRVIKEAKLYEFSFVTFPAQENTAILGFKDLENLPPEALRALAEQVADVMVKEGLMPVQGSHLRETDSDVLEGLLDILDLPEDEKAGRRLSAASMTKLRQALAALQELLGDQDAEDAEGKSENSDEQKTDDWRVCGARDLPMGDKEVAWNGDGAKKRLLAYAGGGAKFDPKKYEKGFVFCNEGADDNALGSYKMPFCDVKDGKLVAMPRGLMACAGALQGSRGGVDVPDAAKAKAKSLVAGYYRKMGMKPPWAMGMGKADEEMAAQLSAYLGLEEADEGPGLKDLAEKLFRALPDEADPPAAAEEKSQDEPPPAEPDPVFQSARQAAGRMKEWKLSV